MSQHRMSRIVLALRSVPRIGPAAIKKNLATIAAAAQQEDVFGTLAFLASRTSRENFIAFLDEADRVLEQCERVGIQVITMLDPNYPERLTHLSNPPPVLFCLGDMTRLNQKTIGVIGSRKPSRIGEIIASRIGSYLAEGGRTSICNGLADGIDAYSVQADERYHKGVVGVMASGLNLFEQKLTSKSVTDRALQVLNNCGVLVSEAAPGITENTYSTIASCRIQAGLSDVLVLVQSKLSGGSRFAVAAFCELPRVLAFVVPPEREQEDAAFEANLLLLRDGATGLANFAQVKGSERVTLLPIRSREDYATILRDPHGSRLL